MRFGRQEGLQLSINYHTGPVSSDVEGVRLCGYCRRPMAAQHKTEYTAARARLLLDRGFCLCSKPSAQAQAPAQGSTSSW
ncbi:hypothetical protein [Actinoplanes italicus]|nr:hypothetical protein [Actinoplanes italicus]